MGAMGSSNNHSPGHCRTEAWHDQPQPAGPCRAPHPTLFPRSAVGSDGRAPAPDRGRWQAGAQAAGRHFNRVAPPFVGSIAFISRPSNGGCNHAMLGSSHARARWGRTHSRRRGGFGPNRIPNERDTPARLCEWDGPAHAPTTSPGVPLPPGHPFVLARRIKPAGRGSTPSLALTVEATRRRAVEATRSHCGGP